MLASALNLQLGWGAKWKVGAGRKPDRNCLELANLGMLPNSLLFAPVYPKGVAWRNAQMGELPEKQTRPEPAFSHVVPGLNTD